MYGAFTLYGRPFQAVPLTSADYVEVRTPECTHSGLGSSHFARRYFGNRCFFLFLSLLRCFSSGGSPSRAMDLRGNDWSSSSRVSPFRDLRIKGYLLLPEAYRSLSRLSSALSARASTPRSLKLNQTDILLRARLPAILRICPQAHSVAPLVQILIRVADFRLRHVCPSFALAQEVLGCPDVSRNQLLDCKTYQFFFFSMQFSRYMSRSLPAPVGLSRLELPTSRLSGVRSNRLSYKPILIPAATCSPMPSPT